MVPGCQPTSSSIWNKGCGKSDRNTAVSNTASSLSSSGDKIGVVSAIVKKRQKVERNVIERALRLAGEMRRQWQEQEDGKSA
ncbi:MAG TPA: hypothetical protein VFA07_05225 [Chthonomonadaceae bacterium]|nr:hypothetical protein [Chthonomonadaceae bacterium]